MNRRFFLKSAIAAGAAVAAVPFVAPVPATVTEFVGTKGPLIIRGFRLLPGPAALESIEKLRREGYSIRILKATADQSMYWRSA